MSNLLNRVKKLEILKRHQDEKLIVMVCHGTIIKGDKVLYFREDPKEKYCMKKRITPEFVKVRDIKDCDIKDYNEEEEYKQIMFAYEGQWKDPEDLKQWINNNYALFPPEETFNENDMVIDFHIKAAWRREEDSL